MKSQELDDSGMWIAEFIKKLALIETADNESVANQNLLKQSKNVKVRELYGQVVAGMNYKVYLQIENEGEYEVRMFVPLPYTQSNPTIQYINQVEHHHTD